MQSESGLIAKLYGQLPSQIKVKAGERVYDAYVRLRRKMIQAELKDHHGLRYMPYFHIDQGRSETLLFLHGFADSMDTFYDACHFLQNDFNIICPDLPGFGKSQKLKDDLYSLENYGDWVCDFIEKQGFKDFHLCGNSMGGAIAAQVALMIPEKLKSLCLISPAGVYLDDQHSIHHELFDGNVIFDVKDRDHFEYFLNRIFHQRPFMPPPVKDFIYREFHRHSRWHRKILDDLFDNLRSDEDPRLYRVALNDRLTQLKPPTLVLWGDEDTLFPVQTAYLAHKLIEGSKLQILHDVGHCPQIEAPRAFSRVYTKFVQDVVREHNERLARLESDKRRGSHLLSGKSVKKKKASKPKLVVSDKPSGDKDSKKTSKKKQKSKTKKKKAKPS